jgi:hypothetical protein
MKRNLLLLFFILICSFSKGQVTGSAVVCPGYVYTYTANIIGAATYSWTIPNGWQVISGQGTSQLVVMCNQLDGDVCADGYDGGGSFIAQNCFTTAFGGDGVGWDADKTSIGNCICSSYTLAVTYNGSSSPCGGCGSGALSPNAVFAVYDSIWPVGNLIGLADGTTPYDPFSSGIRTLTVYQVDTTLGLANAVLIEGSPCAATINNIVQIFPCTPPTLNLEIVQTPVCVGDTFTINENSGLGTFPSYSWSSSNPDIHFISPLNLDSVVGSYSGAPASNPVVNLIATDGLGCPYVGSFTLDVVNCISPPLCSFTVDADSICPGLCVNFTNTTVNGTSFRWYFPGADIDTSTIQDPSTICYGTPGTYDVILVAENGGGMDSINLADYIMVYPPAAAPTLQLINDTLYANSGMASYAWYYNGSLIGGASSDTYVPLQNGNYTVEITDANGCTASTELANIILSTNDLLSTSVVIYPQPAGNELYVTFKTGGTFELEILDLLGKNVFAAALVDSKNKVDVSRLSDGIYTLRLRAAESVYSKKIIIRK